MNHGIDLSVVVAASWSAEAAARTVASIGTLDGVEVIVASDPARVPPGPLPGDARWVAGERGDGVPRLRRIGADAARGRVLAFVEDACVVAPGWAGAIRAAFAEAECLAATGPVLQGDGASSTDWAVYFAEYASFSSFPRSAWECVSRRSASPGPEDGRGAAEETFRRRASERGWRALSTRLAGINFACRRESLPPSLTIREAEFSVRLSGSIRWLDGASVRHLRHYHLAEAFADRWRFGREFGRERWSDRPGLHRRLGLAAAPAILGVQLARLAGCVARRPHLLWPALIAAPLTLALLTAWSLGEALGWAESGRDGSRRRGRAARPLASGPAPGPTGPADCTPSPAAA